MADFRQFYGIDLPLGPTGDDCARWGLLWEALPRESRTARRLAPDLEWSPAEHMLSQATYYLGRAGRPARGRTPGAAAPTPRRRAAR